MPLFHPRISLELQKNIMRVSVWSGFQPRGAGRVHPQHSLVFTTPFVDIDMGAKTQ